MGSRERRESAMSDTTIELRDGRKAAMDQVRAYFEYLFKTEQSGDPFPVDLDTVWPFAYTTKGNAKRALVESNEFYEGEDYHVISLENMVNRPQGGGPQGERILLSTQCMEYFIARKVRPVFEVYRQCRIALTPKAPTQAPKAELPYHLRRYMANYDQVPIGYFSILQELTARLIGPLEIHGYTLRDNMVPDISVGKIFCKWLREEKGLDPDSFLKYDHRYEDGRVVQARLYPIQLLGDFAQHFQEEWLKNRAERYFKERDGAALPYLPKLVGGPTPPKGVAGPEGI
jgi:hypothetical protein